MSELIINKYIINASIEEILTKVKSELTNGKLSYFRQKGDEVKVTCPHHNGGIEKNPDCYINTSKSGDLEYGYCHCFACGFSGRLSKFVGECFDEDETFGENWLTRNFGQSLITYEDDELYDFNLFQENNLPHSNETNKLNETILDTYQSWHPYLAKRGLSKGVCEKFKVKYDPSCECIIFPVWDENDKLYMLTKRSVKSKLFVIDTNKEKPLYLYNVVKKNNINEVTIVESQINCLTLWTWGVPAIALFGTGTKHQFDILNKSNIIHYYLCFDGDSAGDKGTARFLKNIRDDVFVDIILLPRGKDINDLTEDEFNNLKIISSDEWLRRNN